MADRESRIIVNAAKKLMQNGCDMRVLDVGCGYGRNLKLLSAMGLATVGVDVNADAIRHNRLLGFTCFLPDESGWRQQYDLILMSHIIEHFTHVELIGFMEGYLMYLKPKGYLIIASPLPTDYFYSDFTHVKPYPPEAIQMVFGREARQVSHRASVVLELQDIWFRTSALKVRWVKSRYISICSKFLIKGANGVLAIMHFASLGIIGKKDGWVGVFQKVE